MQTASLSSELESLPEHNQLWLALSGGLDSVVLLDLAVSYCQQAGESLGVIHVHHGLSPNADDWAEHCRQLCLNYQAQYKVALEYKSEQVVLASGNLESQARQARYQVFERYLAAGDLLLLAHHADDQLETQLLRLMRGAGSQGLAGMPQQRALGLGQLYRPLLYRERAALEDYAHQQGLGWVEDESNSSEQFDRNYLRHQIVPLLKARWPNALHVAGRSARALADSAELNRQLAEEDLTRIAISDTQLNCQLLLQMTPVRQANLLRFWLGQQGIAAPDYRHIQVILQELLPAKEDAQPRFVRPEFELRRYRDQLHLIKHIHRANVPDKRASTSCLELPLQLPQSLVLGAVCFELSPVKGLPLRQGGIHLPDKGRLFLTSRAGGERIRLAGRGGKSVKKLLQERGVPAWLRDQICVFYWQAEAREEPVCVGVWSPLLSEQDSLEQQGVFWWDESLSIDEKNGKRATALIAKRVY